MPSSRFDTKPMKVFNKITATLATKPFCPNISNISTEKMLMYEMPKKRKTVTQRIAKVEFGKSSAKMLITS